jgi:hypothetical protein
MTLANLSMPTATRTTNDNASVDVNGNRHDARMRYAGVATSRRSTSRRSSRPFSPSRTRSSPWRFSVVKKPFFSSVRGWGSFTDYRIFRIEYVHDGATMEAQVGEPHSFGHPVTFEYEPDYDDPKAGEFVSAIYEKRGGPYVVCTENRGFIRGGPILVGAGEARRVIYFEGYGPDDLEP